MIRALFAAAVVLSGCAPESKCGPSSGTVNYVVDGDTVELEDGTKLRLLLADTPETTQGKNDCYGQEAKDFTIEQLSGKKVSLTYDEAGCQDRFGRTLAYVKVGNVDVNAELVKRGYACFLYLPPSGGSRHEEFETYEAEARTNRTGMWGACSSIPCSQ